MMMMRGREQPPPGLRIYNQGPSGAEEPLSCPVAAQNKENKSPSILGHHLRPHVQNPRTPSTMMFTTTLAALLLSASSTIFAAPTQITARDVWVPKILDPTAATVWHVGGTFNVTWALDEKPVNVSNPIGTVYLSKAGRLDIGT